MKVRFGQNIAKAALWLRRYKPQSTEERGLQILGLCWAERDGSEWKRLAHGLLAEQRDDGGWAQLPSLPSDAYATGVSLYALHQAGGIAAPDLACQKGIKFLLKNQPSDGSWFVRTRVSPVQVAIDEVFSHDKDQWISSIATTWSTMALMLASAPATGRNSAAISGQQLK